jgi:hypothetical protein
MNKILSLILSVSVLANIAFLVLLNKTNDYDVLPSFHPFDINFHVTPESLKSNGYKVLPEDVPILGKTIGDTLIYYQLADDFNDTEIDQLVEIEIHDGDTVYIEPPSIERGEPNYVVFWRNCEIQIA